MNPQIVLLASRHVVYVTRSCVFAYTLYTSVYQLHQTIGTRDYHAIQGSATPSERAFSSGGLTGTKYRNRLNGMVFESLQLLKSAYRNGHISAASDAKQHIDALIAAFDDEEVDDEDLPELIDP